MRICLLNDDGWDAEGLAVLAGALAGEHDVVVVAPSTERSGSGTALGDLDDGHLIGVRRVDVHGATESFCVDAPPAMCAVLALSGILTTAPDLVISGINAGYNTGKGLLHSGTFGAAYTAARFGVPAAAISTARGDMARFDTAAEVARRLVPSMAEVEKHCVLNVNVPPLDIAELGGVVASGPSARGLHEVRFASVTGGVLLREAEPRPREGDTADVLAGHVSVTAFRTAMELGAVPDATLSVHLTQMETTP